MGRAQSVEEQRSLLADLAVWRARHLSDVVATRRATYTIARLHQRLGNQSQAVAEARSLASLFRTPPKPNDESMAAATALLKSLGEDVPEMSQTGARRGRGRDRSEPRGERRPRPERPVRDRPPKGEGKPNPVNEAKAAAQRDDYPAVLKALGGAKGPSAAVLRAFAELSTALAGDKIDRDAVVRVREELGRAAGLRSSGPAPTGDDPLSQLVGQPVPTRRPARIRVLEQFAEQHPDRIDELADVALRHHVASSGQDAPAPWLVGFVGRALAATSGERTKAAIADLRQLPAFAVKAYDEWPFERLLRIMKHLLAEGHTLGPLRRGVLAREEPDDRKLWTLRFTGPDGVERMIAVAPHATEPYEGNLAETLASRLVSLVPQTLFLGTGSGNEALRSSAATQGLGALEHDTDDAAVVAAALAVEGPTRAEAAPGVTPPSQLVAALQADPFEPDAVAEAVGRFRRPDRALRSVIKLDLDDERTAALLGAIHEAVPADQVIPEGTTLAVRTAAQGPQTQALIESGPAAARFGGPGISGVIDVARAAMADGWSLHRVLQGPTRRESRNHPAVQTLAGSLDGLWRLLVRRGDQRGELWYVAELPAEGRAAIPLLLLEEHERAVVLANDEELVGWWGSLTGAPSGIPWTPEATDALKAALDGFATEPRPAANGEARSQNAGADAPPSGDGGAEPAAAQEATSPEDESEPKPAVASDEATSAEPGSPPHDSGAP